ncbi:heterocyst development glycosyltransferase HepC [Gloeocapsopsis dulcis]|uniref:UDP-phosphate galactose phosphotransferase n=1 Tax=Gloeocapsopsis dulcis AAB1 = 1H9 TaxID=1433147 RepID=A0A6N8FUU3_9CHRO|nr:heterocyst development glycosyltransferase HepC [Gloeocapsopsis dulcis]MUL35716.1 UDP-phosphate galactose phosphotransferase [Gloeocapsopsis dulcis AAB1 = 1H9]WNN91001.1 sugar transferase [Gloeocapsopsis dulcis]
MSSSNAIAIKPDFSIQPNQPENYLSSCNLIWRQQKLLVNLFTHFKQPYMSSLDSQQRLVECLRRSPIQLIRLDSDMSETQIRLWADASHQANKSVYLRLPTAEVVAKKRRSFNWFLKRLSDWVAALGLLMLLMPLMMMLSLLIYVSSPGPIFFQQWRVGERGKLFRIYKFRTMVVDAEKLHHQVMANQNGLHKLENDPRLTSVGVWMRKYSLDELPQLFNVLRGEMSLVGPRPWALYDAIRVSAEGKKRLNALPGITGAWQVQARSTLLDINAVNSLDLDYLHNWSLAKDLKILLQTFPKVLSGFGAF